MDTRPDVDLLDPRFHVGDPHPAYRWMRENEPLYRDRNGIWCATRMEHVREVERHAKAFTSSRGYRSVWTPTETSMISKDDPAHTEQRRLIADRFTPRAVAALEDDVRGIVTGALAMVELGRPVRGRRHDRGPHPGDAHLPADRVARRALAGGGELVGTPDAHRHHRTRTPTSCRTPSVPSTRSAALTDHHGRRSDARARPTTCCRGGRTGRSAGCRCRWPTSTPSWGW